MKRCRFIFLFLIIGLYGCSAGFNKDEKAAMINHLENVIDFEENYISRLEKIGTKEDYISAFHEVRKDAGALLTGKMELIKKHPGLKSLRVQVSRFPEYFEKEYIEVIKKRLDISKLEYNLTVKYKAKELDNFDVFILGNTIKESVFIGP